MDGEIRAVIFDLDGVLVDAKDWHYESLNQALALLGHGISRYDHLVTYDGLPTRRKLEMLTLESGLPTALHGFLNEMKQKYFLRLVHQKCRPRFHHEFAVSKLKALGYRLAVASNAIRPSVEVMLEKTNLISYFDLLLSNQDVERAKPDPEIYRTAIERLGLRPEECLVVEDNENGIRAAEAAGAHLLIVDTVDDVNFPSIRRRIQQLEGQPA